MSEYLTTIGLEIHAELKTNSKAFCSCSTEFGGLPNTQVCPVCLGMPGALPMVNRKAIEQTIMAGLAFGCNINNQIIFERKNYFYPDLAKSYQICQLAHPICTGGGILLSTGKFIRFNRIHMEEDAGKLIHNDEANCTFVDFNRSGIPLLEMVTEPDFDNGEEVTEFLTTLRQTLVHIGVANCKIEEGGFRIDVNISIRKSDDEKLGTRVELKNICSLKSIAQVIEYEKQRQLSLLENGEEVKSETRGWNDDTNETFLLRVKESENDYRYFADPSIMPIEITPSDIQRISKRLPQSITDVFDKYKRLGLTDDEVETLANKSLLNVFDTINNIVQNPREVINWMFADYLKYLKEYDLEILLNLLPLGEFAYVIQMTESGKLSRYNAKNIIAEIINTGKSAKKLIAEMGVTGSADEDDVKTFVCEFLERNAFLKEDYFKGKEKVLNFCVGQIMRYTNGKADADKLKCLIQELIEGEDVK